MVSEPSVLRPKSMDEMEQQIMLEMSEKLEEQKQSTEALKSQIEQLVQSQAKLIQSLKNLETMMPRFFSQTSIPSRPPSQPPDPPDFKISLATKAINPPNFTKADSDFGEEIVTSNEQVSLYYLPVFDGTLPDCWIVEVDRFFELGQYGNEEKLDLISLSVEGAALKWFRRHRREFTDWTDIKRKLVARFGLVKGCSPPEVLPKEKLISKVDRDTYFESEKESTNSVEITSIKGHEVQGTTVSHLATSCVDSHVTKVEELHQKSASGSGKKIAHQLFDKMPNEYQKDLTVIESSNKEVLSFSHKDDRVWEPGGVLIELDKWNLVEFQIGHGFDNFLVPQEPVHVKEMEAPLYPHKSTGNNLHHIAHQLLDKRCLRIHRKKLKTKCLKSWRFKFKISSMKARPKLFCFVVDGYKAAKIYYGIIGSWIDEQFERRWLKMIGRFEHNENDWPKGESKPHKKKSHQTETFEVISSLEPSRRCRNDSLDVVDERMCNELVCEEVGDSIITMSAKFGKTYEDPRFELVCLKQSHDPVEINMDNFESALTISSLRHTPTYQYRAPFNPYQNCNDQCDRESEEIEDDELQESLVVVNDLSYDHGCVIGKTIGSVCVSELGQDNSLDREEFKGFKLGKLLKNERQLSIVCLLGIMDMSCWTQFSSLLKANEMSLRERDRWKRSEKQRTYEKVWKFKYVQRFTLSVLLQNEQHKLLQGRNIKCKMKKMEVLRRIKQFIVIEVQFHMKNNSECNFQANTRDAELETILNDGDTFQKPLKDFYRACSYDYMALRVLELNKDKASRKRKLHKNWWFKYKLNTWLSGVVHHTGFVKIIGTFSPMINETQWDKETWVKLNPESCKGGSLLEFLKRHEARFDMIKVPNNTKFFNYLKFLVKSYTLRIEDALKGCKFVKFTMEQSEKPLIMILSYEWFHSPRPPELSCCKEDEESTAWIASLRTRMM